MDAAKLLIQRATLDAGTVAMLHVVLNDVWTSVEPRFSGHPARIRAPITIANALLNLAAAGERDPTALRSGALQRAVELLKPGGP